MSKKTVSARKSTILYAPTLLNSLLDRFITCGFWLANRRNLQAIISFYWLISLSNIPVLINHKDNRRRFAAPLIILVAGTIFKNCSNSLSDSCPLFRNTHTWSTVDKCVLVLSTIQCSRIDCPVDQSIFLNTSFQQKVPIHYGPLICLFKKKAFQSTVKCYFHEFYNSFKSISKHFGRNFLKKSWIFWEFKGQIALNRLLDWWSIDCEEFKIFIFKFFEFVCYK